LLVTIGFLYFASIGFGIAQRASTKFGAFLAVGMTALIVIQGFLNIAAVAVLIPFGGMPLPFFTYGGSSTIMTLICVGVLLNVSKEKNQVKVRGS
jgi:cell division protein FtsW